jgi:integrase/recombinase XerD
MPDDFTPAVARRCLPVAHWPESDRAAWAAAHRRGDLLDDDGPAASWAAATSDLIARGYGTFLSFLAETEGLHVAARPEERVTRARIEAYVAYLRERNHSSTVAARILQLGRAVAVMAPQVDWTWLRRIAARLRHMARPARDDRARLPPAATIRDLSVELMQRAEANNGLSVRQRALLFRDGLLICVLSACALRARNIVAMSIGTTFQRRGDEWWVAFNRGETKNGRPFEMPLPGAFTHYIERYITQHRPQLTRRSPTPVAGDTLWISDGGRPLTTKGVAFCVSALTKRELGRALNPHLLRKIVQTELAIRDPAHVGIAQALLGHADYRTTQSAYNLARSLDAASRHHAVVQSIRAGSESAAAPVAVKRTDMEKQSTERARGAIRMSPRCFRRDTP